jgi:hypothetical protein
MTRAIDTITKLGAFVFGALFLWEAGQVTYGLVRKWL